MKMHLRAAAALAAAALAWSGPANADSSAPAAGGYLSVEETADFAKQIERDLAAHGVRVAMVFRSGRTRDDLPNGISYTHGAFWVYRSIEAEDGRSLHGYAVYNLYNGDGETLPRNQSYLRQDWPIDFVMTTAIDDVGVIVPSPEMQRRMLAVIDSPTYASLHNPSFSLIANPHQQTHQNCNAFMLDVIAAAAWDTNDRDQIRANVRAHFRPARVEAGVFARIFGPMADPTLRMDDQSGPIVTTTFSSMATFMADNGLIAQAYSLVRDPAS